MSREHLNSDHLSMVASMIYSAVAAPNDSARIMVAVAHAKTLIQEAQRVADEFNEQDKN